MPYTRMNKQNMLTVGYMYNCEIQFSVNAILPYDENRSFLSKSCYFGHKSPQILFHASCLNYLFTTQN